MTQSYDAVIVGAGPAGIMAAKNAAESGLRIALIERKTDISKITRTDGGALTVNYYTFGDVPKFNRKLKTFVFPVNGFSIKYDGPWSNDMYGFHIYSPGGNRFMLGDFQELKKEPEKNCEGIALSKGRLLQCILDDALSKGVEYFPNTNVTDIKINDDGAVVTGNGKEYQGKFIVAADGINSRIVKLLGLNKDRMFIGTSRNQTLIVDGAEFPDTEGLNFVLTMYGTFSVTQQAVKGQLHVGTFSYDKNDNLTEKLTKFTKEDPVYSKYFKNVTRMELSETCVVNVWAPIEIPYKDHVVLVGDSCWSQEFSTTASLCAGNKLGHALTKAFHDKKFDEEGLSLYMDWYKINCFEPHGKAILGGTGSLSQYLNEEELDYLAALPGKPAPHTMSFYKLFQTIMGTYKNLVPRIKEERPEIMEKLKKMGQEKDESAARRKKDGFPNR